MVEKLLDFLTSKNSIENSKLIRTFCYLIMAILASSWYSHSLHKYTLNFDYKFLLDFIFSGKILPCILLYILVYSLNEIGGMILFTLYSILMHKIKKKADNIVQTAGERKIKKDYLTIRDVFRPILISLGVLQIVKGEPKMNAEVREFLKRYCDSPRVIVMNIVQLLVFAIMTYITYNVTMQDLIYIPSWLNLLVTIIFYFLIFISFILIFFLAIFEVNIPALRVVYDKVKPLT
jgi:hypothetical protein